MSKTKKEENPEIKKFTELGKRPNKPNFMLNIILIGLGSIVIVYLLISPISPFGSPNKWNLVTEYIKYDYMSDSGKVMAENNCSIIIIGECQAVDNNYDTDVRKCTCSNGNTFHIMGVSRIKDGRSERYNESEFKKIYNNSAFADRLYSGISASN